MENPCAIKYWYGGIGFEEGDSAYQWYVLDKYEQQRADGMGNAQLRRRYVATHARLRCLLGGAVNVNPAQLRIHRTQYGKPYLADYPEVAFNLSHTGSTMAVAIAFDCELGIDIELCKPRANLVPLTKKCFGKEELDYWQGLPEIDRALAFYRFWTRKEAFIKATGRGIALGLCHQSVSPR
jgi:4'-phosphopantetheinyl transferase